MTESHVYPIGRFNPPVMFDASEAQNNIARVEKLPENLLSIIQSFPEKCWEKSYRENGWNARQIVHHLADSHMNALIRFKLALTEDNPVIKPYEQDKFATLPDSLEMDPKISWGIIEGVHYRLVHLLKHMTSEDFQRSYIHPEYNKTYPLFIVLALYAWHGEHHAGQLEVIKTLHG
ncbi:MAG: putative metal-dependent hydrolase [Flavobacteriales bacterium]|nr:putative metal-dependent hydrolase [Flavobacteriales bacterium]